MAGGRDILTTTTEEVKLLLTEYNERKYKSKVLGRKDEKIELVDRCLACLPPHERELVINLCIKKVSERDCARITGLTRYRVRKEKERLIALAAAVFQSSEN